ncbi:MAG: Z1 domain-containing protein [Candidatus Dormiibacterota bacterium]
MTDHAVSIVQAALDGMKSRPSALEPALAFYSGTFERELTVEMVMDHVAAKNPNDPIKGLLERSLQHWDFLSDADWADGTAQNTHERRAQIYSLLKVNTLSASLCDQFIPVWIATEPPIVIAEAHLEWYEPESRSDQFYLPSYCEHLRTVGWSSTSVETMAQVTASVVERISDPCRVEQYQSKGLVVGYVQSGKTAHFTGVIARAADAGYRLFVVLAGTMDILRRQTQRRIDKELIGKELLEQDYTDDDEWDSFLSHGGTPSQLGAFDWQRLTGPEEDFQRLKFGIDALEFPKVDPSQPLYAPVNLRKSRARIMVIKKNPAIIKRVARDLARIRARLADIPALVIDDESDLASVNTKRPTPRQVQSRTATNLAIVELLKQLPRSQYIGYTATPFANVFIDPTDAEDLFPKDFIISLPRPEGYMGIQQFHDLNSKPPGFGSNEAAYVRDVDGPDESSQNLPRALDSYILSGAIKLFRQTAVPSAPFKHHTMLVHVSQLIQDQADMAALVEDLLDGGSYNSGEALDRLEHLWEEDFAPVTTVRAEAGAQSPMKFAQLRPYVGECLQRLNRGKRVLIVNGSPRGETPDFDRQPIWKIVCGGAKLSRGYTVEGLTISYYRRRTNAADTLMQMGRWFGFRQGYADLVRLFIGRAEPYGRARTLDLYQAFEAVCRDEMEFRGQLLRYASLTGEQRITPKQVPPLVPSHLLRPTSSNKMYNAEIVWINMSEEYKERTLAPVEAVDVRYNDELITQLLGQVNLKRSSLTTEPGSTFDALTCSLKPDSVVRFLDSYRWLGGIRPMQHELEFLSGTHGEPEIDDWLFLAPQLANSEVTWSALGLEFTSPYRSRTSTDRFGVYSDPSHVQVAKYIAQITPEAPAASPDARGLRQARRGVFLFYPVHDSDQGPYTFTMGFALQFPVNSIATPIVFTVRDPSQPTAVVVRNPHT